MKLPHYIITTKLYWKVNPLWQKLVFHYHRKRNQGKEGLKGSFDRVALFTSFLKAVVFGIALSIVAVGFLEYVEHRLVSSLLKETGSIQSYIAKILGVTSFNKGLDNTLYKDFASILAALAGIYFATVSIVASTSYAQLSREARNLVWAEKLNNFYFTLLVSLIGAMLILAAINAYGYATGSIVFFATILFSIVAILGFVFVNIRLFNFFDPTTLLDNKVIPDIGSFIEKATVNGFQWNVPAVQQHYQRRVVASLDIFENVVDSSFKIDGDRITYGKEQLKNLLAQTLRMMRFYGFHKASIPADSLWFRRTNKQPEWFTCSSSVTDIGLHTGGSLQPEQVPDYMWLEKELAGIVVKILKVGLASKDCSLIASLYNSIQQYVECLTKEHSADTAHFLLDCIRPHSQDFITSIELTKSDYEDVEGKLAVTLAVADSYSMSPVSIVIGYRKGVEDFEKEKFSKTLNAIQWLTDYGIYKHRLPQEVGDQLRFIQKGLRFEVSVEGKILSPEWYITQLGGIGALKYLSAIPERIVALIQKEYVTFTATLIGQKRYLIAFQVIERGLEACNKCEAHFKYYAHIHSELEATQRVQDIPKPNVDWKKASEQLEECREQLIRSFAKISPTTASIPQHPSLPDYFGKAYWLISQECLRCIVENKSDLFKLLFSMYFIHVFAVYNRFLQKYQETKVEFWAIQNMDIVRDLLALSGYALVYGELGNKELWETVKHAWEAYITALKEQKQDTDTWLYTLAKTASVRSVFFGVSKRFETQTSWMMTVSSDLAEKGILRKDRHSGYPGRRNKPDNHMSPIVECVLRSTYMGSWHYKAEDIFVASYILPMLPEHLKKDIDAQIKRLAERIDEIKAEGNPSSSEEETGHEA